jgi:phosphoglycerate dehydrogenase-like enzyme
MSSALILVNAARGGLVDEEALGIALRNNQLLRAGLDVFSQEPLPSGHPLLELDTAVLTPHSAGPTWLSFPRRFANCFANIERVERGETRLWVVDELADLFPVRV